MLCRLCLQTVGNNNCQPVGEFLLESLKLNKNICKENVMCLDCANCLQVCSNFTPNCVYSVDRTLPLSDLDICAKLEPEAIETKTNLKSLMETELKCSFCTQAHGRDDLVLLKAAKEYKFLVNMLERCILEKNLKHTEELLTCKTCLEALQSVILKCLEVEEKISKYIKLEGTDDKGQVELKDVRQFMSRPIIKSEIDSLSVDKSEDGPDQVQEEYTGMAEAKIKYEKEISNTELTIKMEDDDDIKFEQDDCDITDIKSEQSDCGGFQELFIENRSPSEVKMFQCEFCSYQTKWKRNLTRHLWTHKNPSEIKTFKCEFCLYETKRKYSLKMHLLSHKSPSEIEMFKCALCPYETKHKSYIQRHLLIHKNPSEIKMFKCKMCSYEAKQRSNLKSHLLTHKDPCETQTFECELCLYETEKKANLIQHLLVHESRGELKMFI